MQKLLLSLVLVLALPALAGEQAGTTKTPEVGELDAARAGEIVTIMGQVLAIEPGPGGLKFYQIKPDQLPDLVIWATTFVRVADGQINTGDRLAFKGYIAMADALDPTGRLKQQLGASSLLQARSIETSIGSIQRDVPIPIQPQAR